MKFKRQINIKAVGIGSAIFVVSFFIVGYLAKHNRILSDSMSESTSETWFIITIILIYIVSGYLTAALAKQAGTINGATLGLITPFLIIFVLKVVGITEERPETITSFWFASLIYGLVGCGSGGLVWGLKSKYSHWKNKIRAESCSRISDQSSTKEDEITAIKTGWSAAYLSSGQEYVYLKQVWPTKMQAYDELENIGYSMRTVDIFYVISEDGGNTWLECQEPE